MTTWVRTKQEYNEGDIACADGGFIDAILHYSSLVIGQLLCIHKILGLNSDISRWRWEELLSETQESSYPSVLSTELDKQLSDLAPSLVYVPIVL